MKSTKMFGIVALSAMMLMAANCGGPVDPPDGGDGGCESAKADSPCPPDGGDGGQTDFTATVKAFAPAEGMVGTFELRLEFPDGPIYAMPMFACENVSSCEFVLNKMSLTSQDPRDYDNLVATKRVHVDFKPTNGFYVRKTIGLENGKSYETRWGEGEGGVDPGGRTYRCQIGTFSNVRAMLDTTGTKVKLSLGCGPLLTMTTFEGICTAELTEKGVIASDLSSIHFEQWRNGVMEASCDAPVTQ